MCCDESTPCCCSNTDNERFEVASTPAALQVYDSLKKHSLSDAQHALILPAHMLGQTETKRQQLRRALHHQRAGIALPEGARLEHERRAEAVLPQLMQQAQVHSHSHKPRTCMALMGHSMPCCPYLLPHTIAQATTQSEQAGLQACAMSWI